MSVTQAFDHSQCIDCRNSKLQKMDTGNVFVCTAFGENTLVDPKQASAARSIRGAIFKELNPFARTVIAGVQKGQPTTDPFPTSEDVLAEGPCGRHDSAPGRASVFRAHIRVFGLN